MAAIMEMRGGRHEQRGDEFDSRWQMENVKDDVQMREEGADVDVQMREEKG